MQTSAEPAWKGMCPEPVPAPFSLSFPDSLNNLPASILGGLAAAAIDVRSFSHPVALIDCLPRRVDREPSDEGAMISTYDEISSMRDKDLRDFRSSSANGMLKNSTGLEASPSRPLDGPAPRGGSKCEVVLSC